MEGAEGELENEEVGNSRKRSSEGHDGSDQHINSFLLPLLQELLLQLTHLPVDSKELLSGLLLRVYVVKISERFVFLEEFRYAGYSFLSNSVEVLRLDIWDMALHPVGVRFKEASLIEEGEEEVSEVM